MRTELQIRIEDDRKKPVQIKASDLKKYQPKVEGEEEPVKDEPVVEILQKPEEKETQVKKKKKPSAYNVFIGKELKRLAEAEKGKSKDEQIPPKERMRHAIQAWKQHKLEMNS